MELYSFQTQEMKNWELTLDSRIQQFIESLLGKGEGDEIYKYIHFTQVKKIYLCKQILNVV